jgi:hypothetical protein
MPIHIAGGVKVFIYINIQASLLNNCVQDIADKILKVTITIDLFTLVVLQWM